MNVGPRAYEDETVQQNIFLVNYHLWIWLVSFTKIVQFQKKETEHAEKFGPVSISEGINIAALLSIFLKAAPSRSNEWASGDRFTSKWHLQKGFAAIRNQDKNVKHLSSLEFGQSDRNPNIPLNYPVNLFFHLFSCQQIVTLSTCQLDSFFFWQADVWKKC